MELAKQLRALVASHTAGGIEGLGSILIQAFECSGKGSYCREMELLELNASQAS